MWRWFCMKRQSNSQNGQLGYGFVPEIIPLSDVVDVVSGNSHTLFLTDSGLVYSVGLNTNGELGLSDFVTRYAPVLITSLLGLDIKQIATGQSHNLALTGSGSVYSWGKNDKGQLGSAYPTLRNLPLMLSSLSNIKFIVAGGNHSLVLNQTKTFGWGANDDFRLCISPNTDVTEPQEIQAGPAQTPGGVKTISAGNLNSALIDAEGNLWTCGSNSDGQLGLGDQNTYGTPQLVPGLIGVKKVGIGSNMMLAVTNTSESYSWGSSFSGELGNGKAGASVQALPNIVPIQGVKNVASSPGLASFWITTSKTVYGSGTNAILGIGKTPTKASKFEGGIGFSAGATNSQHYTIVITADHTVIASGTDSGQFGLGTTGLHLSPVRAATSLLGVDQVSSKDQHSLVLDNQKRLWTMGQNGYGQLGQGDTSARLEPTLVPNMNNVVTMCAGEAFSIAMKEDRSLWSWGQNTDGQLGLSNYENQTTPFLISAPFFPQSLACGQYHALYVANDTNVWVVGRGGDGQLGNGLKQSRWFPELLPEGLGAIQVSGGSQHSLVLLGNGTVLSFGYNNYGQLGTSDVVERLFPYSIHLLNGIIRVSAGLKHSLALHVSGTVFAFGDNSDGQLCLADVSSTFLTPAPILGFSAKEILASTRHSLFIEAFPDYTCFGVQYDDVNSCSSRGACITQDTCQCLSGFIGNQCQIATCFGFPGNSTDVCRRRGSCNDLNTCTCNAPYSGSNCELYTCNGKLSKESTVCSGNGYCWGNNKCECYPGYSGNDCQGFYGETKVFASGSNSQGQFGNNLTSPSNFPVLTLFKDVVQVQASETFSMAVKSDGKVVCAGDGGSGIFGDGGTSGFLLPQPIPNVPSAWMVSCGDGFCHVLTKSGEVWSAGLNGNAQLGIGNTTPQIKMYGLNSNLNGTIFLSAGRSHSLILIGKDRQVVSFGTNTKNQLSRPGLDHTPGKVVGMSQYGFYKVAAGDSTSFFITDELNVFAIGANDKGQLGFGDSVGRSLPEMIPNFKNVIEISAGTTHTVALKSDNTIWTWGNSQYGQGGTGDAFERKSPTYVYQNFLDPTMNFTAIDVEASWQGASSTSFLITPKYHAYIFGGNDAGQGGIPETNRFSPVASGLIGITSVSSKFKHTLWIAGSVCNGTVRTDPNVCNGRGFCTSTGTCTNCTSSDGDFCESFSCFGVKANDTLVCGGRGDCISPNVCSCKNGYSGLQCNAFFCDGIRANETNVCNGQGTCLGPNICKCFAGFSGNMCATQTPSDVKVFATGNNNGGQFGLGFGSVNRTLKFIPLPVEKIVSVQSGNLGFAVLLTSNRSLLVTGQNNFGQLGTGDTLPVFTWQSIETSINVLHVSCGDYHCSYVTSLGTIYSSGRGTWGQLGKADFVDYTTFQLASGVTQAVFVSAGGRHTVALLKNGTVVATGRNIDGQLGLGDYVDRSSFTTIVGLNDIRDISAGETHSLAVTIHGSVFVWGANHDGQLCTGDYIGRPIPYKLALQGQKAASAGSLYSMFLSLTGEVWNCGSNVYGQLGRGDQNSVLSPSPLGQIVASKISAGSKNSTFILTATGVNVWGRNNEGQLGTDDIQDRIVPTPLPGFNTYDVAGRSDFTILLAITSCFGNPANIPTVCSGRGVCTAPNKCENCILGWSGPQCEVLNVQETLNLTTNLENTVLAVSNTSTLNIGSGTLSLTNSTLNIAGTMNVNTGATLNLAGTVISIAPGAKLTIGANTFIGGDASSSLDTSGAVSVNLGSGTTSILIKIKNSGAFHIVGSGNINITNSISQSESASFTSLSSNITCAGNLVFRNGFLTLGGSLTSKNISITGAFVKTPNILNVVGSLNLNSTILLEVASLKELNQLIVSDSFNLFSTVIIKLSKYFQAKIGDELDVIPFASDFNIRGNFVLIGGQSLTGLDFSVDSLAPIAAPNRELTYDLNPRQGDVQRKKLKIVVSYSIGDDKSQCTYLGRLRNFEFNILEKQISMAMLVPVPSNILNIGIGWNTNSTFDLKKVVLFNQFSTETFGNYLVDSIVKFVPQIFGVGPQYYYLSVLINKDALINQTHLFYFETTNNLTNITTNNTNIETFAFKVGKDSILDCSNFVTPFRAEVYSPAGLGVLLCLYFIVLIVCIFYAVLKVQPMVSRGISPFVILFFCFVQLIAEIRNYYYPTESQASLCLFYAYLYYPAIQTCYIVILFYYIRYFLIINMNEMKNSIDNNVGEQAMKTIKKRVILIKIFLSKWTITVYLFTSYVVVNLLFTIVLASNSYVCSYKILLSLKILHCVELIVIYFVIMGSIFFDMGMNWRKLVRCQWINYFLYSDPFWFRSQIILFLIYLVYQFVADIVLLAKTSTYIDTITNYYTIAASNTVSCVFLVVIDVLFPLILTVWTHFNHYFRLNIRFDRITWSVQGSVEQKVRVKAGDDKIGSVMGDTQGYQLFLNMCKAEYSVENIQCWTDIQKYKKNPSEIKVKEIETFYLLGAQSIMEVNIPGFIRASLLAAIKQSMLDRSFEAKLFDDLEKAICTNLSDTFSRLVETTSFKAYKISKRTQQELLDMLPK